MKRSDIELFIDRQLDVWDDAARRHAALGSVRKKRVAVNGAEWNVVYNPARSVSTGAKIDDASIKARRCFLCDVNRPCEQSSLAWRDYDILVNPYPVFPGHLTIARKVHEAQSLAFSCCSGRASAYSSHLSFPPHIFLRKCRLREDGDAPGARIHDC